MDRTRRHGDWDDGRLDALARDLRRLYRAPTAVPGRADQVVLSYGRRHLRPRTRIWLYRVATAAAVLLLLFGLVFIEKSGQERTLLGDVDRSGTVDILDAFQLARRIEQSARLDPRWDLNGDGIVDRKDVDVAGSLAVRLGHREVM
ncbi:MAG: hypothetical protein KBE04_03370 [Phycisphaerae bacterium]|nr:hypothetical protein [Phycisphaerae bacterium]